MRGFLAALEFLTRLRVRATPRGDMHAVALAQAWFPVVGFVIGVALLAVDRLAGRALPGASVDVLVVVTLIAVTGALHLDGLADAADGLLGGADREQRLAIMRDVRVGTYALVVVVAVLALKWAGLLALPQNVRVEALLLVPMLARFAIVVAAVAYPYAREEGVGASLHEAASPLPALVAGSIALVVSLLLLGPGGLLPFAFAIGVALAFGWWAKSLVGGMTGDLYGATVEIEEALLFLFVAALANRGWLDAFLLD